MTQQLPPETIVVEYAASPLRPSKRLIIYLCWIIIIGIVALEFVANIERSSSAKNSLADNPALTTFGHCVIGLHVFAADAKNSQADSAEPLIEEMNMVAKSLADRARVAIICGEVEGRDAAKSRLDALAKSQDLTPAVRGDLDSLQVIYRDGPDALSQGRRKNLESHFDWFAKVALSFNEPNTLPMRSQMLADAKRAFLADTGASAVGVGGLVLGLALCVVAIVLSSTGRLPLLYRAGLPDSVFLEAFAIYLGGFVALSLLLRLIVPSEGLGWSFLLTIMLPIALAWPTFRGKSWAQTRMEFGWYSGRGILREICCGIAGYIAAIPALAIMLLITFQLIRLSGTSPSHPVMNYLNGSRMEIALIYFLACVWAPVFEESMFRGALFNHLRARHGWWISAGIVGLLFAAVHPQGWTLIPMLGSIGVVLCAIRQWRGSLIASMAAHAMNNGLVLTLALLTSR